VSESGVAWCCIYAQVVLVNCHFDGKHVDGGSFVFFLFFLSWSPALHVYT